MDQLLPETRGPVLHEPKTESLTQRYDSLIELYTLADRLLDFTTAELVIDKRWSWSENRSRLSFVCFTLGFLALGSESEVAHVLGLGLDGFSGVGVDFKCDFSSLS